MLSQKLRDLCCGNLSLTERILLTVSLLWVLVVAYLTWWNGLNSITGDKGFRWDEWIWFGVVPAIAPYFFYFIWKKKEENKE